MNILIVDDREANRMILETKIKANGFSVTSANNGTEALKMLRSQPFDLVVSDLLMPEMDGYQLTHAIKTDDALKNLPILIYTSTYTDPKDEALAFSLGADAFILKPATDEEFFAAVHRLVRQAAEGTLQRRQATAEELTYLRDYSERLVHKLEDKVLELENTQSKLQELNASLETKVKDATVELREANEELEAFAYSVSHDLRSPLRAIQGFVTAVISDQPPLTPEERNELLSRAASLAVRGQELVSDLLEYSRLKSAELSLEPVSLDSVVRAAVEKFTPTELNGGTLDIQPLVLSVVGHKSTLTQAVYNLLANALKFTKPNTPPHVTVAEEHRNGFVRLSITDRGIGIKPEYHEQIFKVFERLHGSSKYAGSGVGLAIVQRAVKKMGGRVGIESSSAGSTFWIELPTAT